MNVLIITDNNYPYRGTISNLINKILNEGRLTSFVNNITILCGKNSFLDADNQNINGVEIEYINTWAYYNKETIFEALIANPIIGIGGIIYKVNCIISEKLFRKYFVNSVVNAFYYALKKIPTETYDVIFAASGRYDSTKAALCFAKKNSIPLILYQVDPCLTNHVVSKESYNERLSFERELLEYSNAIITTPFIYGDLQRYVSPHILTKTISLEMPLIVRPKYVYKPNCEVLKLMFLGTIYGGIRDPQYLLSLIDNIKLNFDFELHFVGISTDDIKNYNTGSTKIICHGRVTSDEATRLMQEEADVLINLGNKVTNQVPSKIFEYISTGKPIINICKNRQCLSIPYFRRYPLSINLYEEKEILGSQKIMLKNFIETTRGKVIDFSQISEIFHDCTPEYCSQEIKKILEEL